MGIGFGLLATVNKTLLPHNKIGSYVQKPKIDVTNPAAYQFIAVGKVDFHKTPKAWGTAIFVPQLHKYPGSNASDTENDAAAIAQGEIYEIIRFLVEKARISLVVTEGELTGTVPVEKVAKVSQKIQNRNKCLSLYKSLKYELAKENSSISLQTKLFAKLDQMLVRGKRDIALTGGAIRLKAENIPLALVGAENKETQNLSKTLVRNYVYLQDRAKQLNDLAPQDSQTYQLFDTRLQTLFELFNEDSSSPRSEFAALSLEAAQKGKERLLVMIQKTEKAFINMENSVREEKSTSKSIMLQSLLANDAPSRSNNPYSTIRSKKQLENMMEEVEHQIEDVVVQRRNRETAQNFANAVKTEKTLIGILQFGAGHLEGLVAELQKQGLSVIVVMSKEVLQSRQK